MDLNFKEVDLIEGDDEGLGGVGPGHVVEGGFELVQEAVEMEGSGLPEEFALELLEILVDGEVLDGNVFSGR